MRAEVERAGGDATGLSVLAPLPLRRRPDRSIDLAASMAGVPSLVDAGVTDLLVHLAMPDSAAAAEDAFSALVTAFREVE